MKKTKVIDGSVTCPKCGQRGSFTSKRTLKGKVGMGLLAPKRLMCNGCGVHLKTA